tara:strand:- start:228 stop:386 length:159 start_codon:yes stop_codon:yes gene_type:complete
MTAGDVMSNRPVALRFVVSAERAVAATVDLIVQDMSDHPGRHYELRVREVRA